MKTKNSNESVDLSIYIASRKDSSLNVEMHFAADGLVPFNQWQQYIFKLQESKPIAINQGYVLINSNSKPEIMPDSFFQNHDGVKLEDFLFIDPNTIKEDYVGEELVEVQAGSVKAKHFIKKNNNQVVEYWISSEVDPIGLVKLVSKGHKEPSQNYTIELKSLLENVAPSINPNEAIKMKERTKKQFKIK
jgi:hypothetical protein